MCTPSALSQMIRQKNDHALCLRGSDDGSRTRCPNIGGWYKQWLLSIPRLQGRGRLATWIFRSIPSSEAAIQYSLGRQPGDSPRGNGPTATRTEGARSLFELIPNLIARRKPPVRLGIDGYYYALSVLGVWFIAFPRASAWLAP